MIIIDIVDKKTKLILGVVWTIILRYQIQKIEHSGITKYFFEFKSCLNTW